MALYLYSRVWSMESLSTKDDFLLLLVHLLQVYYLVSFVSFDWWNQPIQCSIRLEFHSFLFAPVSLGFGLEFPFYFFPNKASKIHFWKKIIFIKIPCRSCIHNLKLQQHNNQLRLHDFVYTWLLEPYNQEFLRCHRNYQVSKLELYRNQLFSNNLWWNEFFKKKIKKNNLDHQKQDFLV